MTRVLPRGVRAVSMAVAAVVGMSCGAFASSPVHADTTAQVINSGHIEVIHAQNAGGKLSSVPPEECISTVVSEGHVDIAAHTVETGGIKKLVTNLNLGTGSNPVWKTPDHTLLHVKPSRDAFPEEQEVLPGHTGKVWYGTQSPVDGVLFLGMNSESVKGAQGEQISLEIKDFTGPGAMGVHQFGIIGDVRRIFSTKDGKPNVYTVKVSSHHHATWVFTAEGRYNMTIEYKVKIDGKEQVSTRKLLFAVGDTPIPAVRDCGDDPDAGTLIGSAGMTG